MSKLALLAPAGFPCSRTGCSPARPIEGIPPGIGLKLDVHVGVEDAVGVEEGVIRHTDRSRLRKDHELYPGHAPKFNRLVERCGQESRFAWTPLNDEEDFGIAGTAPSKIQRTGIVVLDKAGSVNGPLYCPPT